MLCLNIRISSLSSFISPCFFFFIFSFVLFSSFISTRPFFWLSFFFFCCCILDFPILHSSDQREGVCYQSVTRDKCSKSIRGLYKKDVCCCSVGAAWGKPCEECPLKDTSKIQQMCILYYARKRKFFSTSAPPAFSNNLSCWSAETEEIKTAAANL